GGAQVHYGITSDLITLGRILGGGMPVGAFGGKREIMQHIAPTGPVYQAGTLCGNPVAMAAGLATLELISAQPDFHARLSAATKTLAEGLRAAARDAGIPLTVNYIGGMFGFFFTDAGEIHYYEQVMACDVARFKKFFHAMLNAGVYLAPSAFEAGFVSGAHGGDIIDTTLTAARGAFAKL